MAYSHFSIDFPVVVVLCVFGSYSINNSTFYISIMLVFGILGYVMTLFEISGIPFLIAFVLAPMLERGLRRSLTLSGGSALIFFKSPIAIIFFILTILAIISISGVMFRKMK